jgi:hypothetical protein
MATAGEASGYVGNIPRHYDQNLGPLLFTDYAADLAGRIATLNPRRVLETAALPKADIQNLACAGAVTLAALISPSSPGGVVTEQLGLNIDGYLLDRPICRRPREHSRS